MDSKQVAVLLLLLLLLLDSGHSEEPGSRDGDQVFAEDTAFFPVTLSSQEEDGGPHPPQYAQTPGTLLRFLLQAMERPGRSPAFLFHPQRFGRNTWGSWSKEQLSPQAREFWSLTAPQRFGKK